MLDMFFEQSPHMQLAVLLVHGSLVFLLSLWFVRLLRTRFGQISALIPVAPSFVAISSIYALFLAFHGASIWSHQREAEQAFVQATTAAQRFTQLVGPGQVDSPEARAALQRYVDSIVHEEWNSNLNSKASLEADAALRDLHATLVKLSSTTPGPVVAQLFKLLEDMMKARSERLWLGTHHTDRNSWVVVLVLGFLSHLSLASVHIDRPRAAALTLALFSCATTVAYWLLAVADDPYLNRMVIDPEIFLRLT